MKPFPLFLPLAATFFTFSVTGMPPEDTRDERIGEYIDTEGQKTEVQYPRPVREDTRDEKEEGRIIGGADAAEGQFPWAVALFFDGSFVCTGSIIGPRTVLTAAHCVFMYGRQWDADLFHAIAHVSKSSPTVRINFLDVVIHPEYRDDSLDNDIAVFTTIEPITFDGSVDHICIARPNTPMNEYKKATAMGWGRTSRIRINQSFPDILQYVEQHIVDNTVCRFLFTPGVNDDKICAKGVFNGICSGDSGGPLVHMSSPPVQIGIASYINGIVGCGKINPAVFTRLSSFYDFIMQNSEPGICTI